jgi:hypothetical protein
MLPIQVYKTCPYPLHMIKCFGKQHESKKDFIEYFCEKVVINYQKGEMESPSLVLDN